MEKIAKGYVVPHTHWDREWRYPLWENRLYLRDLMEELIDTLEKNNAYQSFLMDGQVVAILDYLEVCPEKKERVKRLITQNRIQIGPWYTLPDLYPISGESIVRNLLKGKQEAQKLGGYLKIGYESFGWGQPSQLPQIYKGFDIDTVIVSKNVDKSRAPQCEFKWTGHDGTSVYATRLGNDARANFFMNAYLKIMTGKEYKEQEYEFQYGIDGQVYHQADEQNYIQDYFRLEKTEYIHKEYVKESIDKVWNAMKDTLLQEDRIMMDGTDSTTCQPQLIDLIKELNKQSEGIIFESATLEQYVNLMKEKLNLDDLLEVKGEMRDGPTTSLSGNALMTRPYIKTFNKQVQNKLFQMAEPTAVAGMLLNYPYETQLLELALNYVLLAHPHDSINGVTQDKTVDDVMYRLAQAEELASAVYNRGIQNVVRNIDFSKCKKDEMLLVLYNPSAKPRKEIIKVYVDIPQNKNTWDFSVVDSAGEEKDIQFVKRQEVVSPVVHLQARPFPYYADRHEIYLETGELPAGGYMVYHIIQGDTFYRKTKFWAKTRKTNGDEIARAVDYMENEFLCVQVNRDGSLNIEDKRTKESYGPLNFYESTGDVGDYWMYYAPYDNKTYTSKGLQALIYLKENGNLSATIGVEQRMSLPKFSYRPDCYIQGKSERSSEMEEVRITTFYTLKKSSSQVEVKVKVENKCQDHKMSVCMETGVETNKVNAQGHFCVDERNILPLRDEKECYYNELTTQPMQNFVSVFEENRGMGVITDCLGEYEYRHNSKGILGFTLFRAVRNIICTEFRSEGAFLNEQGGQLQRNLSYYYAICPMKGDWQEEELLKRAEQLNVPVKPIQTSVPNSCQGNLPFRYSFYQVEGNVEMSCIKKSEDGNYILLRLWNPGKAQEKITIHLAKEIKKVWLTDLKEETVGELTAKQHSVSFTIGSGKIHTIKVEVL